MFPQPGEIVELIDSFDKLQTIVDPTSGYVQAAAAATARYWDDGMIAAATGSRQIGTDIGALNNGHFLDNPATKSPTTSAPRQRSGLRWRRSSRLGALPSITTTTWWPIHRRSSLAHSKRRTCSTRPKWCRPSSMIAPFWSTARSSSSSAAMSCCRNGCRYRRATATCSCSSNPGSRSGSGRTWKTISTSASICPGDRGS